MLREFLRRSELFIVFCALGVVALFQGLSIVNVFRDVRPGVLCSIAMLLVMLLSAPRFLGILFQKVNATFVVFLLIEGLSVLNYVINPTVLRFVNTNPDTLAMTISYLIVPSVFFYTAGVAVGYYQDLTEWVLDTLAKIALFCIGTGVALQLSIPGFYVQYLLRTLENNVSLLPRMSGYLGISMLMGAICATSIPIVWRMRAPLVYRILGVLLCVLGSLLTLQRGSIAAAAFISIILLVLTLRRFGVKPLVRDPKTVVLLAIFGVSIGSLLISRIAELQARFSSLGPEITSRAISFNEMIDDRSFQWDAVREVLGDYPLGLGVGMMSHVTAAAGFPLAVPDGNYFRILGELGPFGLFSFLALLLVSLWRGMRNGKTAVVLSIGTYMIMAIGTNVFDFYYSGFVFWMLLGLAQASFGITQAGAGEVMSSNSRVMSSDTTVS